MLNTTEPSGRSVSIFIVSLDLPAVNFQLPQLSSFCFKSETDSSSFQLGHPLSTIPLPARVYRIIFRFKCDEATYYLVVVVVVLVVVKVTQSCPTLATPWTVAHKVLLSTGFSRQEYWSGLPFPSPGDLPDPGIESMSPSLQADSLPTELGGKPYYLLSTCLHRQTTC